MSTIVCLDCKENRPRAWIFKRWYHVEREGETPYRSICAVPPPPPNPEIPHYDAYCIEHDLKLISGRCDKCRDAAGNMFPLDMQSCYLLPVGVTKAAPYKIHATNRSPLRIFVKAELAADGTLELDLSTITHHPSKGSKEVPAHDSTEIEISQGGRK